MRWGESNRLDNGVSAKNKRTRINWGARINFGWI